MKRRTLIILVILFILLVIGFLYDNGAFENITWQPLVMLLAALAGPYMFVKNALFSRSAKLERNIKASEEKYNKVKQDEAKIQEELYKKIEEKDKEIERLNKEMDVINSKLDKLYDDKSKVDKDVDNLNLKDTQDELKKAFG